MEGIKGVEEVSDEVSHSVMNDNRSLSFLI